MYSVQLVHNGQQITLHEIHDFHTRSLVEMELNLVYEAVSHLICPVHHLGVQMHATMDDAGKVSFLARTCCGDLKKEAQEHLAHLPVAWE